MIELNDWITVYQRSTNVGFCGHSVGRGWLFPTGWLLHIFLEKPCLEIFMMRWDVAHTWRWCQKISGGVCYYQRGGAHSYITSFNCVDLCFNICHSCMLLLWSDWVTGTHASAELVNVLFHQSISCSQTTIWTWQKIDKKICNDLLELEILCMSLSA